MSALDLLRIDLIQYLLHKQQYYENDVIEQSNHVAYRKADPVDHLEMIMAQTRAATFEAVADDIFRILSWSYDREKRR